MDIGGVWPNGANPSKTPTFYPQPPQKVKTSVTLNTPVRIQLITQGQQRLSCGNFEVQDVLF